jgi:hypothetical protein
MPANRSTRRSSHRSELEPISRHQGVALASLRAAQGREEEAEELWRSTLRSASQSVQQQDWYLSELYSAHAQFLNQRGREDDLRAVIDEIRPRVEGRGAKLSRGRFAGCRRLLVSG